MNELEVKKVPFMGTELMAARGRFGRVSAGCAMASALARASGNGRLPTSKRILFSPKGDQI